MKKRILTSAVAAALLLTGCISENEKHVGADDAYFESIAASYRGIEGVMPTIGKIYIDSVTVDGTNDGDLTNMRKAALNYVLSADLIVNDYSVLAGGNAKCIWQTTALGTSFTNGEGITVINNGKGAETLLSLDNTSGSYVCAPVNVSFTKEGTETNFDPDSIVTLSFTDNAGNPIKRVGYNATYTTSIVLNTADRHNILTVATSPTSVLYYRADGLFQAGFTAYRGLKGVEKYIGTATYEAYVQSPGAATKVDNATMKSSAYTDNVTQDIERMQQWVTNSAVDKAKGIHSESAFVSSYGPPIALPPFRENLTEKDYRKLRLVLMRHNNFPIIISNDKKLYTMGRISNLSEEDRKINYAYFIRSNDNWFQYSGVDVKDNYDDTKLHVGEIKIADGTPAKFVSTLSVTSDLGTIVSLNEYDKEYYIAGNPFYNEGFCDNPAVFSYDTYSFNFDVTCQYNDSKKVGAVKIPGLQKLIGDGEGVLATDTHIYYSGNDGKMYQIDLLPNGENYSRIKQGLAVIPRVIGLEADVESPIENKADRDKLYAIDLGLPNMNPVLAPTFLMNDGSIVFTARTSDNTGKITFKRKHFYINEDTTKVDSKPGDLGNVPLTNILGPTVGYGANGKLYYFTDVHALGISYAPNDTSGQAVGVDNDYLAFVYGDPIQQLGTVNNKVDFFQFKFGELDIQKALTNVSNQADIEGNNFVLMPYNPYTDAVDDVKVEDNGSVTITSVAYRPFRTNTHLFVNMRKGAQYNYIVVPHYAYAFQHSEFVEKSKWVVKENGLMAAEVRNNDISKVFGAFKNPKIPFKYTPYGRNTAFFANKKGVFAFTDYDVRKNKDLCQTGAGTCGLSISNVFNDKKVPDYFYRGFASNKLEESSGRNNYISTPFVQETRMSNFPNNENYTTNGFEPQLLSSWISYEATEIPDTNQSKTSTTASLAGYIPQFFYESMKGRTNSGITFATEGGLDTWLGDIYQYAYGAGIYHYYSFQAYPVWRARKLNTEVLQYQARYGTLLPMTHGATADYLFTNLATLFKEGPIVKPNNGYNESTNYLVPRLYTHAHYTFYDKDKLASESAIQDVILGGIDIETTSIGEALATANTTGTGTGAGVGYIMDTGNYMWRANSPAATAEKVVVSATNPMNKIEYFNNFVVVHK